MSIYNSTGTREGLIRELRGMRGYLADDEAELLALTDSAIGKLTWDEKGDIKNGALTLMTFKGGVRTPIAVIR